MEAPFRLRDGLASLSPGMAALLKDILRVANDDGLRVFLVGGPVRDLLLERPSADIDLCVELSESSELTRFERIPKLSSTTYFERFGTLRLTRGGASIDLACIRQETYARPGSLPRVAVGSLQDDLLRRDFSINAMAIPLSKRACEDYPSLVDPYAGLDDLEAGRMRILHPASFYDDPTRAIRAARFCQRFDFRLTTYSHNRLRDALRDGAFANVSGERWLQELHKLSSDVVRYDLDMVATLRMLDRWHIWMALEPGLQLLKASLTPLRRFRCMLQNPRWEYQEFDAKQIMLMLWFFPLAKALRKRSLKRFALRGQPGERILTFSDLRKKQLRCLGRAQGRGAVAELLNGLSEVELMALDCCVPSGIQKKIRRFAQEDRERKLPIGGTELRKLGLEGAEIGQVHAKLKSLYLDGRIQDRRSALAQAQELAARLR